MLRREKISDVINLSVGFLPDKWDSAILGFAEQATPSGMKVVPCYGYQALKAVLQYKPSADMYRAVQQAINDPDVHIVHKLSKHHMWNVIYDLKLPRWELMDAAIIGVMYHRNSIAGVCFNKITCDDIIKDTHAMTEDAIFKQAAHRSVMLENNILPIYLGENSPWYLTPIQ